MANSDETPEFIYPRYLLLFFSRGNENIFQTSIEIIRANVVLCGRRLAYRLLGWLSISDKLLSVGTAQDNAGHKMHSALVSNFAERR